jgi:hypothetical protein
MSPPDRTARRNHLPLRGIPARAVRGFNLSTELGPHTPPRLPIPSCSSICPVLVGSTPTSSRFFDLRASTIRACRAGLAKKPLCLANLPRLMDFSNTLGRLAGKIRDLAVEVLAKQLYHPLHGQVSGFRSTNFPTASISASQRMSATGNTRSYYRQVSQDRCLFASDQKAPAPRGSTSDADPCEDAGCAFLGEAIGVCEASSEP